MSTAPQEETSYCINENVEKNFLKDNLDKINFFLSKASEDQLIQYFNENDKSVRVDLWKNLIIDSISFLKINDARETLFSSAKKNAKTINGKILIRELFEDYDVLRNYNCYGIEDLKNYIDDFVNFESVLYGADHHYRDHVDHVINVWAIGIILLFKFELLDNLCLSDNSSRSDEIFSFNNYKKKLILYKGEIIAAWTVMALCHDLGYPIEKASKINEKLKLIINHFGQLNIDEFNYNFSFLNNFLVEKFLNITSSKPSPDGRYTKIQSKYRDKLSKSLEDYRHGVFSGLLLYKTLTYFLETDFSYQKEKISKEDIRQFYIRKEILRAISAHTSPKLYHLNIKNLAFLLFISDELNDWGRPNFEEFKSIPTATTDISVYVDRYDFSSKGDNLKITINYNNYNDINEDRIRRKYRVFYHLLRTAKDDAERNFFFRWTMVFIKGDEKIKYRFRYDSSKTPDKIIKVTKQINETISTKFPIIL